MFSIAAMRTASDVMFCVLVITGHIIMTKARIHYWADDVIDLMSSQLGRDYNEEIYCVTCTQYGGRCIGLTCPRAVSYTWKCMLFLVCCCTQVFTILLQF